MIRQIKFRAWDYENRTMLDSVSLSPRIYEAIYGWDKDDAKTSLDVMQFTGLLDKNGKEIYEGDVIKNERGYLATVVFEVDDCNRGHELVKGMFDEMVDLDGFFTSLSSFTLKYHTKSDSFRIQHTEIIGNIYENPNLLKL